ncbi:MAG: hypothetical protein GWN01_01045 [Nitrosopumilaceae archaeon]|nr:hypothetical protein [Nitrosopumilaceae archaeon]NIU85943.1 hypothetical protein [Nitrosopumilaceae archaeon]NIX60166.1 hypothetical protein [Nitrosopumilaceae archaeon]
MERIVVVGSGASGVHFALSLLKKGYKVLMLDVGFKQSIDVKPHDTFPQLKENLLDPVEYFLGKDFEAVVYPSDDTEYYGFPPSKNYVFEKINSFSTHSRGFQPLLSFAQGGLGEAWTAGSYAFNDVDLRDFPFKYKDIEPYYNEVARRIGIAGEEDDLAKFFPVHDSLLNPLELDEHSKFLLLQYQDSKEYLNKRLSCYLGRSRIAVLSHDKSNRKKCQYLGRCIWGCPINAFYTPSLTLEECKQFSNFKYIPGIFVKHFQFNHKRQIERVIATDIKNNKQVEFDVDKLILAAGTLPSSKIYLDSIFANTGKIIKLPGLMDNRQILVPFLNLPLIGKNYNPETYQYHQLAIGFEHTKSDYIHGQITTLKTAMIHPIVQSLPTDLRTSLFLFKYIHAALGMINLMVSDNRRDENFVSLERERSTNKTHLIIKYSPKKGEQEVLQEIIKKLQKALRKLRCIVPPGMIHIRPMGASVHYAGTIPMSATNGIHTSNEFCQSNEFNNLYFADGTTFPFLPSKNLTLTLMANATRVAECMF